MPELVCQAKTQRHPRRAHARVPAGSLSHSASARRNHNLLLRVSPSAWRSGIELEPFLVTSTSRRRPTGRLLPTIAPCQPLSSAVSPKLLPLRKPNLFPPGEMSCPVGLSWLREPKRHRRTEQLEGLALGGSGSSQKFELTRCPGGDRHGVAGEGGEVVEERSE